MYTSPFDPERFPAAPVPDVPVNMSPEGAKVLERLRSALPDPLDWNAASPIEMSTALARAIFDHEAARLTLDLPDDRMDLPVALHMDDPRLLHLLDTARHMHRHDPSAWPTLMDMALEAVQAETANVMSLDVEGLDARDLDNQNMPLYETIHEDMLDHRLETRYQGILNPGTLTAPPSTPWMPPLPGTYQGVLPVRPSPMPLDESPERPTVLEQPQPQPQSQRSDVMPEYQIREITDPATQQVSYQTVLNQVSQHFPAGSRMWGMDAENDALPLTAFASPEAARTHIETLQGMEPLRESLRNLEPVMIAGVPYDPVRDDNDNISSFRVRDGSDRTDMLLISPWELQQYAHTGKLTPELATQQLQNAERSGYVFTPFETRALQEFARDANADPRFGTYRKQEGEYLARFGGTRSSARNFSMDDLPRVVRDYVQAHRFDDLNGPVPQRPENLEQAQGRVTRQDAPASAQTAQSAALQAAALQAATTETGLRLQDLYLPDAHRQPMRIDTAFRESDFIRAFYNTNDANAFMNWIDDQKEQRAALDRGEPLTLGQLRYVPAGVPGEYRATDAETGQPIDRQIIDQSSLHDLLHNGVVRDDMAQQWQMRPDLLTPILQTIVDHRQKGMYDYASVVDEISRYAPAGIAASPQTPAANPPTASLPPAGLPTASLPTASPVPTSPQGPSMPPAGNPARSPETEPLVLSAAERQAQDAAANAQGMEYKDEVTADPTRWASGEPEGTPAEQEKTQEAQQKGQAAQQKDQKDQQKDQKNQQENQAKNDGQNQKGQGQGQGQNGAQGEQQKAGFSLFSRVHQHHHYTEPAPASEKESAAGAQEDSLPKVTNRDTMNIMKMMDQSPVTPEEINVMRHRVEKEGLTTDVQKGIEQLSARGQRDVKDGKLTPDQLQKNAHAMNQLGDTVNRQPDSPQKESVMDHIHKLTQMLVEALKRIFSMGRASAGPSM